METDYMERFHIMQPLPLFEMRLPIFYKRCYCNKYTYRLWFFNNYCWHLQLITHLYYSGIYLQRNYTRWHMVRE